MPELPDLEIFAENLRAAVLNKNVTSAVLYSGGEAAKAFSDGVCGHLLSEIRREGKEMYFGLSGGVDFTVHLMLSGGFTVCPVSQLDGLRFKIMSLCFDDGSALAVTDYQYMCRITLNPALSDVPDALGGSFTEEYFLFRVRKSPRKNIKALLIDQSFVRGIGNAYVDEILWKANISPESTAGKIPENKLRDLYAAVGRVLISAIASIKRISPTIISGEERSFLSVHNSRKQYADDGARIIVGKVASKITYYTEKQELYK